MIRLPLVRFFERIEAPKPFKKERVKSLMNSVLAVVLLLECYADVSNHG